MRGDHFDVGLCDQEDDDDDDDDNDSGRKKHRFVSPRNVTPVLDTDALISSFCLQCGKRISFQRVLLQSEKPSRLKFELFANSIFIPLTETSSSSAKQKKNKQIKKNK